jgi:hypothetical protein
MGSILSRQGLPELDWDEAVETIQSCPGLLPVDIDLRSERLIWLDVGDTHFGDSYFFVSTKRVMASGSPLTFTTGLELLDCDELNLDAIAPTGFIFHMGRSGSTLLAKTLAQSPANLVISEAPPHFLWPDIVPSWIKQSPLDDRALRRFRNLVLAMGRRRRVGHLAHFIKFTSHMVLFLDMIRAVFPKVPALFIYRNPAEVMVGFARQRPGWQHLQATQFGAFIAGRPLEEVKTMSQTAYCARYLAQFLQAALRVPIERLRLLNYGELNVQNFPTIAAALGLPEDAGHMDGMLAQFQYYSKRDGKQTPFEADSSAKLQEITPDMSAFLEPELMSLYRNAEQAENNLYQRWC